VSFGFGVPTLSDAATTAIVAIAATCNTTAATFTIATLMLLLLLLLQSFVFYGDDAATIRTHDCFEDVSKSNSKVMSERTEGCRECTSHRLRQ
jgi:hypothetical protein